MAIFSLLTGIPSKEKLLQYLNIEGVVRFLLPFGFSFGDPAGIRTQDPQLRRLLLYPAELPDHPYFRGAKVRIFLFLANF